MRIMKPILPSNLCVSSFVDSALFCLCLCKTAQWTSQTMRVKTWFPNWHAKAISYQIQYNFFLIKRHLTHWGYKPNHFQSFTFEYKLQVIARAAEIGNRAAHSPQLSLNLSKWRSMINRRNGGLELAIYRVLALIHWYLGRFNKTNQKCIRRVFKAALLTAT